MSNVAGSPPTDSAYIAHLWQYPDLTVAIFGLQFSSPEGGQMYAESGISEALHSAVNEAEGMLCMREFQEANGGMLLQYWRSHEDLAAFSKRLPHMDWWKWLIAHDGQGMHFYHEIYQCKTAEAVFVAGTPAIGPGVFCETTPVALGEGRSVERQRRFVGASF